jgi:hypothetical protein
VPARVSVDGRRGRGHEPEDAGRLKNCDDVGIGASIKTAIGAHSEMASATPNVELVRRERLVLRERQPDHRPVVLDPVAGLDPVLGAGRGFEIRAEEGVQHRGQGVRHGHVADQPSHRLEQLGQQFTDINGMANSAVGGSMSTLDPQLGSSYKPASAATPA